MLIVLSGGVVEVAVDSCSISMSVCYYATVGVVDQ